MGKVIERHSVYRPTPEEKRKASRLREEFIGLVAEHQQAMLSAERRMMRMGQLAQQIQDGRLWLFWTSKATGRPYRSFDEFLKDAGLGKDRSIVYDAITAAKQLKDLRPSTLEKLGKSKCYELARVRREAPRHFRPVLRTLLEKPELTVKQTKDIAATAIANPNSNEGTKERWVNMEFLLRDSDAQVVKQALAVCQTLNTLADPDSDYTLGRHLKLICENYLTDEDARRTWKQLDKAGAFTGSSFRLED
jgi:hypothetical protein